jgi:hypothetical protein
MRGPVGDVGDKGSLNGGLSFSKISALGALTLQVRAKKIANGKCNGRPRPLAAACACRPAGMRSTLGP